MGYTAKVSRWEPLGIHGYRVEGDVFFWRPRGAVQASDAAGVCAVFSELSACHGYVLWLIDAELSIPVGFETRQTYVRWMQQVKTPLFVSAFRAQVPARTTAELVARGSRLVHGVQIHMENFATEAEARGYLAKCREQLLSAQACATGA